MCARAVAAMARAVFGARSMCHWGGPTAETVGAGATFEFGQGRTCTHSRICSTATDSSRATARAVREASSTGETGRR